MWSSRLMAGGGSLQCGAVGYTAGGVVPSVVEQ